MKSISLCIKINMPVIYHNHPFSEISITHDYFDFKRTENHTKELASLKLTPFLASLKELSEQFGTRFNLGLSINGISTKLLQKYAPALIDEIKLLADKGTIDFFAEPWSNSVLPALIEKELVHQTNLQIKTIQEVFGRTPSVFLADNSLNEVSYNQFEPYPGCKTKFTYSNHLAKYHINDRDYGIAEPGQSQFLINHFLSNKLQHLASDQSLAEGRALIAPFIRYIRKHVSLVKPLILQFDPLAENISTYKKFQNAVTQLLNNSGGSFYSLSDLEEVANYFAIENNYSEAMLSHFKHPDYWLKNNMQQEAFKQFNTIYKRIRSGEKLFIPEAWDYLQDINNFFYMSDFFFLEEFAGRHFNPYRSPHEAFTSYMNAAGSFWNIKDNKPDTYFKTNFLFAPTIN